MLSLYKKQGPEIFWWTLLTFIFLIPISSFLSVRVLILVLLFSFFIKGSTPFRFDFFREFWDVGLYFVVLLIGLSYSQDLSTGLKVIESNFSFLALPVVFSKIRDFNEVKLKQICIAFLTGLFLACTICLVNAIIKYNYDDSIQVFFFYNLTEVIHSHPTYLAYYLIFGITFGLYLLNEKSTVLPIITSGIILFFFLMLMLTGGQTSFMSLLLVCSFFVLKFILEEKSTYRNLTVGIVVTIIIGMFLVSSIDHGVREEVLSDSWDRLALWKSAVMATPNVFLGVGTGDYKIILNEYYQLHGMTDFAKDSFNSHNQFIQIFFTNGVLGFVALGILMGRTLYLSVRNSYSFGILVFFPFIIYGMTEVFLGRYQGIIFFSMLHQIFIRYYGSVKPAFVLKGS